MIPLRNLKHTLVLSNEPHTQIKVSMKTFKSILALFALTVLLTSCSDSDCKNCSLNGDFIGEVCGENLKIAEDTDGMECKKL